MKLAGKFISFEGVEGSGKTTQVRIAADRLRRKGHEVLLTREPGGTRVGEEIRRILAAADVDEPLCAEAELLLFAASRAQLVRTVIRPALARGMLVISDRFFDSTTVYQGRARGLDKNAVLALNRLACGDAIPDITIVLDLDTAAGMTRLSARADQSGQPCDRIEGESAAFHESVREGYLELAAELPERIKVIDGSVDVDSVAAEVWRVLEHVVGEQAG